MIDVTTAARRFLAEQESLTTLLGGDSTYKTWIFRWRPYVKVEGSGKSLLVVRQSGSWASANAHNTMRFPRLIVEVWSDVQRAESGLSKQNVTRAATAEDAAQAISLELDKYLHRVAGGDVVWGREVDDMDVVTDPGLRIIGCYRQGEPDIRELQGGDGAVVASNTYTVTVG